MFTNARKIFTFSSGEVVSFAAQDLPKVFSFISRALNGHFPVPSRRETHMFFFSEKSLLEFRVAIFIAFPRSVFGHTVQADSSFSCYVRAIWHREAGVRDVVFGPK
jgi:hypothetical protein